MSSKCNFHYSNAVLSDNMIKEADMALMP